MARTENCAVAAVSGMDAPRSGASCTWLPFPAQTLNTAAARLPAAWGIFSGRVPVDSLQTTCVRIDKVYAMTKRPAVSLIVITRDEETLIGQCLESARSFCDELIVVDSLSTDRTVEIAKGLGALVFEQEFTDYVRQKQIALDHASSEWVLLLDADEQATYELGREIERTLSASDSADGYRIQRVLYHLRHYYRRPIYRDRPVRLFRRERAHIGGIDPHDKVFVNGRIKRLRSSILHFSYHDIADHVATMNRFTTRGAAEIEPTAWSAVRMFTHRSGASSTSTSCAAVFSTEDTVFMRR